MAKVESSSKKKPAGLLKPGNIDLHKRPVVKNADGSVSTIRSITVGTPDGAVLIPTVIGDKVVSDEEAIKHWKESGENLGVFESEDSANAYAEQLHQDQAQEYEPSTEGSPAAESSQSQLTRTKILAALDSALDGRPSPQTMDAARSVRDQLRSELGLSNETRPKGKAEQLADKLFSGKRGERDAETDVANSISTEQAGRAAAIASDPDVIAAREKVTAEAQAIAPKSRQQIAAELSEKLGSPVLITEGPRNTPGGTVSDKANPTDADFVPIADATQKLEKDMGREPFKPVADINSGKTPDYAPNVNAARAVAEAGLFAGVGDIDLARMAAGGRPTPSFMKGLLSAAADATAAKTASLTGNLAGILPKRRY